MNNGLIFFGILMVLNGQVVAKEHSTSRENEVNTRKPATSTHAKRFSLKYINQSLQLPHTIPNKPQKNRQTVLLNGYSAKKIAYTKRATTAHKVAAKR
ncbi:MAG: hypothetical protein ACRC9T_01920 [Vibrionaceae bacterium]